MTLRITFLTSVNHALSSARQQTDKLAQLQQQASTGNRILVPSDDPLGTISVLANQAENVRLDTDLTNIQGARTQLNVGVSALQQASDIFTQASQLAIEGSQGGNTPGTDETLAEQVDSLLNRLLDVANTKQGDRYLFAGTAERTPPFVVSSTDGLGRPQAVAYRGSQDAADVAVSRQQRVPIGYVGSQVFHQEQRAATAYTGSTGAAAGSGTDSATGQGTLLVQHTSTTFAAGSGVQAGTGSAAGDTVIGPAGAHQLTIVDTSGTGASGTIALDGGPAVAFTNTDTNLKVTAANGAVIYLDSTAIAAGFNGTVDVTANGTLSTDGGASSVAIDFSGNQVVTDSTTGAVTNVNSTNIRQAGSDHLEYTGTGDAFQVLIALRDDLRNARGLSASDQAQVISQRLGDLDRVRNGVLQIVGQQSADLQNLDGLENRVQSVQLDNQKLISDTQGADISSVVIGIQSQSNLLQLTLGSIGRVLNQNLLDFIK